MHSSHLSHPNELTLLPVTKLLLPVALMVSIPAFYLVLTRGEQAFRYSGHILYGLVALLLLTDFILKRSSGQSKSLNENFWVDFCIFLGSAASTWPADLPWPVAEWLLRVMLCGAVFIRLGTLTFKYVAPHRLLQIVVLGGLVLAIAGGGFFWLEPRVHSYADGVWLAFITGATVGYGDLVPSTPASRILAVFIVLLGYALFSVVTASISALLVGEDEKRLSREMHADMRMLRKEIVALHADLKASLVSTNRDTQ